jgi:hypothetical protein
MHVDNPPWFLFLFYRMLYLIKMPHGTLFVGLLFSVIVSKD